MRILHLAYEDHQQPGSGGGSVRTHEINKRLSDRHEITVVTAGYPGAQDRTEDGVHYRHLGGGRTQARVLSYFARLPRLASRSDHDLVVEDFGAPLSTVGVPRFTDVPVLASVQWLFGAEKAQQYHLPFGAVEEYGLRAHTDLLTVSKALADEVRRRLPHARTYVVPNGVQPACWQTCPPPPGLPDRPVVFLGRIERAQKGLDVLLEALALLPGVPLVIAGDGPDEAALRAQAGALGVADRVTWLGRVEGSAKLGLLQAAAVVAMPSRYETFGMVAAEALACGTTVVATDLPCLREVVPAHLGRLVPVDDARSLAEGLRAVLKEPDMHADASAARTWAQRWDWDSLALQQEQVYRSVVAARTGRVTARA